MCGNGIIELTGKNTQNKDFFFKDFVLSKYHKQYAYYNEKLNVSLRLHCIIMEVKKKDALETFSAVVQNKVIYSFKQNILKEEIKYTILFRYHMSSYNFPPLP